MLDVGELKISLSLNFITVVVSTVVLIGTIGTIGLAGSSRIFAGAPGDAVDTCLAQLDFASTSDAAELRRSHWDGPAGESSQGSTIDLFHRNDDSVSMMLVRVYAESGRREILYNLHDSTNYRVSITDIKYEKPIYVNPHAEEKGRTTHQYNVCGGQIVASDVGETVKDHALVDEHHQYVHRLDEFLSYPR